MKILALSYGKNFFAPENDERGRMLACATQAGELHVVVFSHTADSLSSETVADNFYLYSTNSSASIGKITDASTLGRKIISDNPGDDWVITAQDPFAAGLVAWRISKATGVPFNLQEHGDFFSSRHWRQESILNQIWYQIGKFLLRRAHSVRVVAKRVKQTMEELGVNPENIFTLPVRTDVSRFQTAVSDPALIPDHDKNKIYVLSTARFVSQKNLPLMIRAFAAARRQCPQAQLLLVGRGPEEVPLRALVERLELKGAVTFMDWSENVPALMKTADIYALSSNYEGWGRVLIEAQAAGLPIVTTDVGCVGESVLPSESTSVVPVCNEQAFADALVEMLDKIQTGKVGKNKATGTLPEVSKTAYAKAWTEILEKTKKHKL